MPRLESFDYNQVDTRRTLRDRLVRKLRVYNQPQHPGPDADVLPDVLMLELLTGLDTIHERDVEKAAASYAAASRAPDEPQDLDGLLAAGWISIVWGRVRPIRGFSHFGPNGKPDLDSAYDTWARQLYRQKHNFSSNVLSNSALATAVSKVTSGELEPEQLICRTPNWVAGRLWEIIAGSEPDKSKALREWADKWRVLQSPTITPHKDLPTGLAKDLSDGVLSVIEQSVSQDIADIRSEFISRISISHSAEQENLSSRIPRWPQSFVGKALWVEGRATEANMFELGHGYGEIASLTRLLFSDVVWMEYAQSPHPTAVKLIDLSALRPELMFSLLGRMRSKPILLADLILYPPSAALACLLIAQWRNPGGAHDRKLLDQDERASQFEIFQDALEILIRFLSTEQIAPQEAAALFNWFHKTAGKKYVEEATSDEVLLVELRRGIISLPQTIVESMVEVLISDLDRKGLGSPEFAGALDLIALGDLAQVVSPDDLVEAYAVSITASDYALSAHRVGVKEATALSTLSTRRPELRERFLRPFNPRDRLSVITQETSFSLPREVGQSLRAHIRVLCRAAVGAASDVPRDLLEALVSYVRAGAIDRPDRGRVTAFAPRYEQPVVGSLPDRPIAADLGSTLTALGGEDRTALLDAILETEEPSLLAVLTRFCPLALRDRVMRRIDDIRPDDATQIWSLTEAQFRIQELLKVGAIDAAARYLAEEEDLSTLVKNPERILLRFQQHLQLAFLREEWETIETAKVPDGVGGLFNQTTAEDSIKFFQGLIALKGPKSDPDAAKEAFRSLHDRKPSAAHATNWLASVLSRLLKTETFRILSGSELREGKESLTEYDRMVARVPNGTPSDDVAHYNKSLLLLAVGEPEQALAVINTVPLEQQLDTAGAYRAIALHRLGRQEEARGILEATERSYGVTTIVRISREYLSGSISSFVEIGVSINEDFIIYISSSINNFKNMDANTQAKILLGAPNSLEVLIINHVRSTSGAVVGLRPMMKGLQIDKLDDDITAFMHQILSARIDFLGWSVADQTRGGFTVKGNPRERDLVVKKEETVLDTIEAVNCKKAIHQYGTQTDLEYHFLKIFSQGVCRLAFHVTYDFTSDREGVTHFLKTIAKTKVPTGFVYRGLDLILATDSRPPGFAARYGGIEGDIVVVFLILDLEQTAQKAASTIAEKAKKRPAPNKSSASKGKRTNS